MGTRLIAGRDLTWTVVEQRRNTWLRFRRTLRRELWLSPRRRARQAIREGMKDEWREIIGVVGDVRHDGADQKAPADHLLAGSDE